jgi:hypothetical protein
MPVTAAVYADETQTVIQATIDGVARLVPVFAGNMDYQAVMAWVTAGNTVGPYVMLNKPRARYAKKIVIPQANAGVITVAMPAGLFNQTPIAFVQAEMNDGRDYAATTTVVSATSVQIRVRISRTLPAVLTLLTALINYDIFQAPTTAVTVNLLVVEPS